MTTSVAGGASPRSGSLHHPSSHQPAVAKKFRYRAPRTNMGVTKTRPRAAGIVEPGKRFLDLP